jgi:y4mF family transcriptional regulator
MERTDIPDRESISLTSRFSSVDFEYSRTGKANRSSHHLRWIERMHAAAAQSSAKIGEMVRQRRLANRLTQRQLGELAGVGIRLVSELERGKPTLRMDAVNRVLAVFGLMLGPIEAPRHEEDPL